MINKFPRRAYAKKISKLSNKELREALVQEAELRYIAQMKVNKFRGILDTFAAVCFSIEKAHLRREPRKRKASPRKRPA